MFLLSKYINFRLVSARAPASAFFEPKTGMFKYEYVTDNRVAAEWQLRFHFIAKGWLENIKACLVWFDAFSVL